MKYMSLILAIFLTACATPTTSHTAAESHKVESHKVDPHKAEHHAEDEPRPYDAEADAEVDINHTLVAAKEEGKLAMLLFGANWCHDSRALAAHFEKPRFQTLLRSHNN